MTVRLGWNRWPIALVVVGVLLLVAAVAGAYFTDFEGFAYCQASETLTVPGMSFSAGWSVDDTGFLGSSLVTGMGLFYGPCGQEGFPAVPQQGGVELTIDFDTPQNSISFDMANAYPATWTVTGYLDGAPVFSESFMTDWIHVEGYADGSAAVAGTDFDSVLIAVDTSASVIDNIETTDASTPVEETAETPAECDIDEPNRVNNHPEKDCAAPVVIYCSGDAIDIYSVDPATGIGTPLFYVSAEEIAAVGVPTDENAVLAAYPPVILSRLTTGEFQLNTEDSEKNPYIVVWNGCPVTSMYHIEPLFE